jgi:putative ABC transport system permease protein
VLKNYFKIALRNLLKLKAYSLINILGLAIGVAACILILLFVSDELSYDKFNQNAGQIYRIHFKAAIMGKEMNFALSPALLGPTLVKDFPEVIQYVRILPSPNMLIRYKENVFNETRFFWVDSTLFDVFAIPFIKGNPKTALSEPHTLVLTETLAKKYFGNENPIGKVMNFEDGTPYTVKGVVQDCPLNSHFHYDLFASNSSTNIGKDTYWVNISYYTYIVLKTGTSVRNLESKFPEFVRKYVGPQSYQLLGLQYDDLKKHGYAFQWVLQPLTSIHLNSNLDGELEPNSNIKYVFIFSIVALFILVIACINFMNLATARSEMRSKEVGVRKVLGSNRSQLIKQFLLESVLLTTIAVILAIGLVETLIPAFNKFSGKQLHINYFNNLWVIPALIVTILIVGLAAGSYPAFFLSSFRPIKVLKGKINGIKGNFLRSGLVVFQFAISIILFIGTFVVYSQLNYIQEKKLGFDKDQVLVIKRAWAIEHPQSFKNVLFQSNLVKDASSTDNLPGESFSQVLFKADNASSTEQHVFATMFTDYDYSKTLGLELKEGRFFSKEFPSDTQAVVINESTVHAFHMTNPIGKRVFYSRTNSIYTIAGVVKDFHFESMHQVIKPLVIFLNRGQTECLIVKIREKNIPAAISYIKNEWNKFVPNKPFEYYFLDDKFNKLYSSEVKIQQIFTMFSMLAIFIACLGLFGLAAFTAERRKKEIGIRKTLGASVYGIVFLLSKEFIKWVLIANVIAWPVAYYFMNKWLQDFAYKTEMSIWIFLVAGILALIIALLTVSANAIKSATANPIKSLKYE